jgi:hypothetical protein
VSGEKQIIFDSFTDIVETLAVKELPVHPKDVARLARAVREMKASLLSIYDLADHGTKPRAIAMNCLKKTFGDDWSKNGRPN